VVGQSDQVILQQRPTPLAVSSGKSRPLGLHAMLQHQLLSGDFVLVPRPDQFFGMSNLADVVRRGTEQDGISVDYKLREGMVQAVEDLDGGVMDECEVGNKNGGCVETLAELDGDWWHPILARAYPF
jgi:hypothetical protein